MTISLRQVAAASALKQASLAGELAGYLLLAAADQVAQAPRTITLESLLLDPDGTLRVGRGLACSVEEGEQQLRVMLDELLSVACSVTPALLRAARRTAPGGIAGFIHELETALIPVNRAAARRAMARLHREASRLDPEALSRAEFTRQPRVVPAVTAAPARPSLSSELPLGASDAVVEEPRCTVHAATEDVDAWRRTSPAPPASMPAPPAPSASAAPSATRGETMAVQRTARDRMPSDPVQDDRTQDERTMITIPEPVVMRQWRIAEPELGNEARESARPEPTEPPWVEAAVVELPPLIELPPLPEAEATDEVGDLEELGAPEFDAVAPVSTAAPAVEPPAPREPAPPEAASVVVSRVVPIGELPRPELAGAHTPLLGSWAVGNPSNPTAVPALSSAPSASVPPADEAAPLFSLQLLDEEEPEAERLLPQHADDEVIALAAIAGAALNGVWRTAALGLDAPAAAAMRATAESALPPELGLTPRLPPEASDPAAARPSVAPPPNTAFAPVKSDVAELLANFTVADSRDDRELRRDLKRMVGLEPTPAPGTVGRHDGDESEIATLVRQAKAR